MPASDSPLPRAIPTHGFIAELRDIERLAAELDAGSGDDAARLARTALELGALLERAIGLMNSHRELEEASLAATRIPNSEAVDDGWPSASASTRIGDLCFAGAFELKRALEKLASAHDPDALLTAAETARRKVRRCLRAIVAAARETSSVELPAALPSAYPQADTDKAIAVRRLYRDFRRALRRATDDSPEAVLGALRYAAGALAALVSAPEYAHARASDRALLRRLRQRILDWARQSQDVSVGLELLEDVHTCADLLREINRRQELRAHDAALRIKLQNGLSSDPPAFFSHVAALSGLDDRLDELLDRARAESHSVVLPAVLSRLAELS